MCAMRIWAGMGYGVPKPTKQHARANDPYLTIGSLFTHFLEKGGVIEVAL